MSKLGEYKSIPVYDFDTESRARNASLDNDILSVYWNTASKGTVYFTGHVIGELQLLKTGSLRMAEFDENLFAKLTLPQVAAEETVPTPATVPLYDTSWYSNIMNQLKEEWTTLTKGE